MFLVSSGATMAVVVDGIATFPSQRTGTALYPDMVGRPMELPQDVRWKDRTSFWRIHGTGGLVELYIVCVGGVFGVVVTPIPLSCGNWSARVRQSR